VRRDGKELDRLRIKLAVKLSKETNQIRERLSLGEKPKAPILRGVVSEKERGTN